MKTTPRCRRCGGPLGPGDDVLFPADGGASHVRCEPVTMRCRLCQIPVVEGDDVSRIDGEPMHARCHDRPSAGGAIAHYLHQHAGLAFCHTCLGARLGLRWEIVRNIVWSLRSSPDFDVRPSTCTGCGPARVTITLGAALRPDADVPHTGTPAVLESWTTSGALTPLARGQAVEVTRREPAEKWRR